MPLSYLLHIGIILEGAVMKLTAELIFDCLQEQFDVIYARSSNKNTVVGRPLFYDSDCSCSGHICILPPDDFIPKNLGNGVYVSIGELACDLPDPNVELLTIMESVTANHLFNALQSIFDYYDEWENSLNKIVEENKGYPELIQTSARYLDCAISLVDADFSVIAITSKDADTFRDPDNKISTTIMGDLITDPKFGHGLQKDGIFEFNSGVDEFISHNIKKDGRYLGRVTLIYNKSKSKGSYIYLLRHLVLKLGVLLKISGTFLVNNESLSSLHEILIGFLNSTPLESQFVSFKLKENGWSYDDKYILIRLQPEFRHEWQLHATYLIPHLERLWPGACAVEKDAYVAVLLNLDIYNAKSRKNFFQDLAVFLRDGLLLAGISRPFHGLDRLASYYRQTELAVTFGREVNPMYWYYRFDDYVLLCLLKLGTMNFTPEQVCSNALLDLIKYDQDNNTEYYKTLRTFYHNKFNYTHAAESLYIHRTTLIKRIERIVQLTQLNLEDPDGNLYIELSFRYLDKVMRSTS